ncbi:MAG: non-heme iron oxygenase ferredoxin subunit [Bacteroidota bacterium]|nr:non-heme iron oxygenase ferredoxin subunit [Bacteroidota bacterium]
MLQPKIINITSEVAGLAEGQAKVLRLNRLRIAVIKLNDGYYAIDEICSHEEESLAGGSISDGQIECPKHGARFDIKTGEVKAFPAVIPIRTYPVTQKNDEIFLNIPNE